jgi:serine/alanine racemase
MTDTGRREYAGIDYFRLISAFLVVAIHTSPLTSFSLTADFILTRVVAGCPCRGPFLLYGFQLLSLFKKGGSL